MRTKVVFGLLFGLFAAMIAYYIWEAADPAGSLIAPKPSTDAIAWCGHSFDTHGFLLVSLATFAVWILFCCYAHFLPDVTSGTGHHV